jgi:hypothetical protein
MSQHLCSFQATDGLKDQPAVFEGAVFLPVSMHTAGVHGCVMSGPSSFDLEQLALARARFHQQPDRR